MKKSRSIGLGCLSALLLTLAFAAAPLQAAGPTADVTADISTMNVQELRQLAKSYKSYMASYDSDIRQMKTSYGKLESDNQMLNQEYAKLKSEFELNKEESEQKSLYMIIGGLIIGGIAILAK